MRRTDQSLFHHEALLGIGVFFQCLLTSALVPSLSQAQGQSIELATNAAVTQERIDGLMQAIDHAQQQIDASQRDLQALRQELLQMQAQVAAGRTSPVNASTEISSGMSPAANSAEDSAVRESELATLDQVKVESDSKYPLRLTGTLLLNGFVNSSRVDEGPAPSAALGGRGSTGISVAQTVLGLDADGPHLFGASSRADLRVDFFGSPAAETSSPTVGLLRFRTAHVSLDWRRTQLFISLDRPLLNPNAPESLLAVAQPELAWSGNLWTWIPQAGLSHTFGTRSRLRFQAAILDTADPVPTKSTGGEAAASIPSSAELSRKPGVEARIAMMGADDAHSASFGVGGYFSPHFVSKKATIPASSFNAWAATLDFRVPLSHGLTLTGSAYRGQALGGLGGGGYKDYFYRTDGTGLVIRPLEDIGGWSQLHQKINETLSWNVGFGLDNAFSKQLRSADLNAEANLYNNIARNRTLFANLLYSPSAYLLLSLEYREIHTAPVVGPLWISHITGVGAAYRF